MKIILISAVILQISCCYAIPAAQGVSSFAYQDSAGNRYGGTYDLNNKLIPNSDPFTVPFNDVSSFFPDYFRNYDDILQHGFTGPRKRFAQRPHRRLLQRVFGSDFESQRLASLAARKAYDLTYNRIGYSPNFFRFPTFGSFPFFGAGGFPGMNAAGFPGGMGGANQAAFASAMAGPGFSHQIAAINPMNAAMPNVDVTNRFSEPSSHNGNPNFYSVSSSSYASSSNENGKVKGYRGAETVVNDNGKITKYKVNN